MTKAVWMTIDAKQYGNWKLDISWWIEAALEDELVSLDRAGWYSGHDQPLALSVMEILQAGLQRGGVVAGVICALIPGYGTPHEAAHMPATVGIDGFSAMTLLAEKRPDVYDKLLAARAHLSKAEYIS